MRKLKGEKEKKRKAKEEKEFGEIKREDVLLNQMPFTKFDYNICIILYSNFIIF